MPGRSPESTSSSRLYSVAGRTGDLAARSVLRILHLLKLGVSKSSIAKITGLTRTTLYNFIATRGLKVDA